MDAPHPSASAPTGCELIEFEVGHPGHRELALIYEKLGIDIAVVESEQGYFKAVLDTPKGKVNLQGSL